MAAVEGRIDEDGPVTEVVPELAASSAFAEATIGQVLDMVNSIAFSEDYADPASGITRYAQALGWLEAPAGQDIGSLYDFLVTLEKDPPTTTARSSTTRRRRPTSSTGSPTGRPASHSKISCPTCCGPSWVPKPRPTCCWIASAPWLQAAAGTQALATSPDSP